MKIHLTDFENKIIYDSEFLIAKINVIEKIQKHFEEVRYELKKIIDETNFKFDDNIDIEYGKIFKGENYRSLPYVVLDYPKLYSPQNTFTFRTMFWWGNSFSSTLHLEGKSLIYFEPIIFKYYRLFLNNKIYYSVAQTPWEYHYNETNYIPIEKVNFDSHLDHKFIKLNKRFELSDYDNLPELSSQFFSLLLKILSNG